MAIEIATTPAPIEVVTPIKPSEAIRLGCLIAPVQAFWTDIDGQSACAVGASFLGGLNHYAMSWTRRVECPAGGCSFSTGHQAFTATVHLNDDHRWSRERIADWLESLGL